MKIGIMSLDETIKYAKDHEYEQSIIEHLISYRKYLDDRIRELNDEKYKLEMDLVLANSIKNWRVK